MGKDAILKRTIKSIIAAVLIASTILSGIPSAILTKIGIGGH